MSPVRVLKFKGLVPWEEAFVIQKNYVNLRSSGSIGDTVLIFEHKPVLTRGIRDTTKEDLILSEEELLKKHNIKLFPTRRGGAITYHGPGQLVVYPIIDIRSKSLTIKQYICLLQKIIIQTLKKGFNLESHSGDSVGVWLGSKLIEDPRCTYIRNQSVSQDIEKKATRKESIEQTLSSMPGLSQGEKIEIDTSDSPEVLTIEWDPLHKAKSELLPDSTNTSRKIASIGVSVERWVTSQGFSLNVNCDLSPYQYFIACGEIDHKTKIITSLTQELGRRVEINEVIPPLLNSFKDEFESVVYSEAFVDKKE